MYFDLSNSKSIHERHAYESRDDGQSSVACEVLQSLHLLLLSFEGLQTEQQLK